MCEREEEVDIYLLVYDYTASDPNSKSPIHFPVDSCFNSEESNRMPFFRRGYAKRINDYG